VNETGYADARKTCLRHAERLRWAMSELRRHQPFDATTLEKLTPLDLAICDQDDAAPSSSRT